MGIGEKSMSEGKGGRVAGGVLIGAAVLTVGAMLHHPEGGASSPEGIARMAHISGIVHGVLIGLLVVELACVAVYARLRGFERPLVTAGLTFFATGVVIMLPAPVINGFVLPHWMMKPDTDGLAHELVEFGADIGVTFAMLASILVSVGIVLFSIGLMHDRGVNRWFGVVGVITVTPVPVALLLGAIHLNVHGMLMVIAAWCLWFFGLGVMMLRGKMEG